jgi:hypothetical protein
MRSLVEEKWYLEVMRLELEEELYAGVDEVFGGERSGTWK